MTSLVVRVGIWKYAPFKRAILNSIEVLNSFIKSKGWDAYYELLNISPVKSEMPAVDMVMFDGGEDVNPALYGEGNVYSFFNDKRDEEELNILRYYTSLPSPRFSGVCRGHQLLNVFYGGGLWQDINKQLLGLKGVLHPSPHKVSLLKNRSLMRKDTNLEKFFPQTTPFYVSSLHHQAVRNLGRGLTQTLIWTYLRGSYGVNEGLENKDGNIRSVQSHPEFKNFATDGALFSYLAHVDYFLGEFMESGVDTDISKSKISEVLAKKELREMTQDRLLGATVDDRPELPERPRGIRFRTFEESSPSPVDPAPYDYDEER
jgi:putative glutamine amidotransferase